MRILITGGTGVIGRSLCPVLLKAGHDLTVLSRNPDQVPVKCGASVKAIRSLDEWRPDMVFDAVINLAGEPIIDRRWTEDRRVHIKDSRVKLTEALVARINMAAPKPSVLLSGSAVGYYGNVDDDAVDESKPPASDFAAEVCAAWEAAAVKAAACGVRVCLLRTGLVLHESGGLLGRMLTPFKLGLGAYLGDGTQGMSWIHMDDYLAIVLRLLESTTAQGPYNLTAPCPVTNREFSRTLAMVLRRPLLLRAPGWLIQITLGERSGMVLGGQRAIPAKLQAAGFRFAYPTLEAALRSLLAVRRDSAT